MNASEDSSQDQSHEAERSQLCTIAELLDEKNLVDIELSDDISVDVPHSS